MKSNVNFIVLNTNNPKQSVVKEVLAGVEEEGLFCGVSRESTSMDSITLAYNAAAMSSTGLGIGIQDTTVSLAVKSGVKPVLIDCENLSPRVIGQNAARFVKKKPLIYMK